MDSLYQSNLPLVFKGALVLFKAKTDSRLFRMTKDIDCDWIDNPPSNKELEDILNSSVKKDLPEIGFKQFRPYVIGKSSAGFEIYENGLPLTTMDVAIKPHTSSRLYYVGECCFEGYDLKNIVSDKISVLSSIKIASRIKDLIDIYSICIGDDISKKEILTTLEAKGRKLEDFSFFLNNKDDVKHAFDKYVSVLEKPDFDTAYEISKRFVNGFINEKVDLVWSHTTLCWKDK